MNKFKHMKPHVNRLRPTNYGYSTLAVALSHAILKDQVDYRIAKEDAAAESAAIANQGYDDGAYPPGELFVTVDAGAP
jgi:hypothetical protein